MIRRKENIMDNPDLTELKLSLSDPERKTPSFRAGIQAKY